MRRWEMGRVGWLALISAFSFQLSALGVRADQFGDVSVNAATMHSGNTHHGYIEIRIAVENRSPTKSRRVELSFPSYSWRSGNSLSRVSRTVDLPPATRALVPMWQPPLPIHGDSSLRVRVDANDPENMRLPNANNHMVNTYGHSRSFSPAVILVARGLDHEELSKALQADRGLFTAAMATGEPDSRGSRGYVPTSWMPDTRTYMATNWIELDFASPITADKVSIYETAHTGGGGSQTLTLTGVHGTNLAAIPFTSTVSRSRRGSTANIVSFSVTPEPVSRVRLEFVSVTSHNIGIDAVELSGPSGTAWATEARASSDNSAMGPSYAGSSGRADSATSLRAELPVQEWSENWLAYTPFDVIALSSGEFDSLPSAVAGALWRYVQAGGNLMLFGGGEVPLSWRGTARHPQADLTEYAVGFGQCVVSAKPNVTALNSDALSVLRTIPKTASYFWKSLPSDDSANAMFPVVENVRIPTRGIVTVMLIFVILIGPANIIYLTRRKKRTWMLWTIPAISVVTTLLVFAYSMLREGITPDTRIRSATLLDQNTHESATLGLSAFYCPLTPNRGLMFGYETEVTPLVESGYSQHGTSREVDWTQGQHFRRGWVSARVPAHFYLRKTETRRERLQVEHTGNEPEVINGLGGTIKSLWLADADGKVFIGGNIAAGQKVRLRSDAEHAELTEKSGARAFLKEAGMNFTTPSDAVKFLLPGTYIAELEDNPFLENGLGPVSKPERTRSGALVYGILETPGANTLAHQ